VALPQVAPAAVEVEIMELLVVMQIAVKLVWHL